MKLFPNRGLALVILMIPPVIFFGLAAAGELAPPTAVAATLGTEFLAAALVSHYARTSQEYARRAAEFARAQARQQQELAALGAGREAILASLPDPLLLVNRRRAIVGANPAAKTLFGEAILDRPFATVVRIPDVDQALTDVLDDGGTEIIDFRVPGKVDQFFKAYVVGLHIPAPDGTAALVTLHDMTSEMQADRMRSDFIANASHELRTPLASLKGFIETLQGPAKNDPKAEDRFLTVMAEQANRMSRLIEDLLSLSRIELLEHTAPAGSVDMNQVLASVAAGLGPQAKERDMRIVVEADELPQAAGSPDELIQVFQNLVSNAIKYGHKGTEVRICGRAAGEGTAGARRLGRPGLKISIEDKGEGVPPEDIPRLTERFYRVDKNRSRQLGGTGLGLAIVKHIVNRHRGVLEIESEVGVGSIFSVYLPATVARENSEPKADVASGASNTFDAA